MFEAADLVEVVVGRLDVERIFSWHLLPAAVTGAGGAPPAVVVQDGRVSIHVCLLSCRNNVRIYKCNYYPD